LSVMFNVKCYAREYGRRKGGAGGTRPPWILKISAKKGCFLSFEWEKTNFTAFGPPGKDPSDAHARV